MYQAWRKVHGRTQMSGAGFIVPAGGSSSLLTGLVASWKLADTSDSGPNGYTLTNNATVTFNTGKIGNAAYFTAASAQFLSRASNANLQLSGDRTFAAWFYLTDTSNPYHVFAKQTNAVSHEYRVVFNNATSAIRWSILDGESDQIIGTTTVSATTWYCLFAWWNASTTTSGIQIDNGAPETSGTLVAPTVGAADFTIGSRGYTGFEQYINGRIDNVNVWSRVLTSDERAEFYNSGTGKEYPFS